ncbi:MAG TPA: c-type cytochrome biogenesis protein CcmI [Hyphomicrobiales bacterium]|nr:c-type cytochrome biogenesis protein CcmI [Hyphomicrobiales bacterium]
MSIWLVLALMTLAAILAVLAPLARRREAAAGTDVVVYRDQLAEIGRDEARGAIGAEEAGAARLEVQRRLLAADARRDPAVAASPREPAWRRRVVAVLAFVLIPTAAATTYLAIGRPDLPDEPIAARLAAPPDHQNIADLMGRVEARLASHPDDGEGWAVIAPVYLQMSRYQDAAHAFDQAERLLGPSADRAAGRGEALTLAAGGVVTADAKEAFQDALKRSPKMPRARYWLARAAAQDGDTAAAAAAYRSLIKDAPAGAAWLPVVRQALAEEALGADGKMPAVDPKVLAGVPADQRLARIHGMVEGLADRLKAAPRDLGGQLRLVRAWAMLGDRDKAKAAAAAANAAFADDAAAKQRIADLLLGLGLAG